VWRGVFDMKKINLLFGQGFKIIKIQTLYKTILQDESYNKYNADISFGGSVMTVRVHFIMVYGDNRSIDPGLLDLIIRHR
jgi:hypothetical protein